MKSNHWREYGIWYSQECRNRNLCITFCGHYNVMVVNWNVGRGVKLPQERWEVVGKLHTAKKGWYTILNSFFVHILLMYQISTYNSLYTKIFNFSRFCDFHTPSEYLNSYIPTIYQYFSLMSSCIPDWEKFNCVFSIWLVILLDILVVFLGIDVVINTQCVWKYAKHISSKTNI